MSRFDRWHRPPIIVPLIIILLCTVVTLVADIDFSVSNLFFDKETGGWLYSKTPLEKLLYNLSPVPAILVFAGSVIVVVGSIWRPQWRRMRRGAIYWALVMLLGPGLIINAVFKDWYGRPRPKQVPEYGGKMEFCPVWVVGEPGKAKSFPCGHASIGFYFMAGYFYWWRRNLKRARLYLFAGLAAGFLIGFSRIANGSHWFSDVIWAGAFIYFVSYLTAWGCGLLKSKNVEEEPA